MSEENEQNKRIQLRPSDDVSARLNDPKLGTKLRKAMGGDIQIPPALEKIINQAPRAGRVNILLQVLFGYIDDKESQGKQKGEAPSPQPKPEEESAAKSKSTTGSKVNMSDFQ